MKQILLVICFCLFAQFSVAQWAMNKDTINSLNQQRLQTNKRGMTILTSWGAANTLAGGIGYFTANTQEWKAFHGMNAIWGITNFGLGVLGRYGVKRELAADYSCGELLHRYEADKRLFLINGGLDLLYIGTGVFLKEHAKTRANPATWKGFGNSILIQGAFLLLFDGTMYLSHQSKDKRWYKLLNGICVTGNGVGVNYTF